MKNNQRKLIRFQPITIQATSTTWQRDSHGLFDYESSSINQNVYKSLGGSFQVVRCDNEVIYSGFPQQTTDSNGIAGSSPNIVEIPENNSIISFLVKEQ